MVVEKILINIVYTMDDIHLHLNEEATKAARRLLDELKAEYGVSADIREPTVYNADFSRWSEFLRFVVRDFLGWPLTIFRGTPPTLAWYQHSYEGLLEGRASIIMLSGSMDRATLEHEVRHHFSYECRRIPYVENRAALSFLRKYYWEDRHAMWARRLLSAIRKSERVVESEQNNLQEAITVLQSLSRSKFPESRLLPDAIATVIAVSDPWVNEGFASEKSLLDAIRAPFKVFLGTAAAGVIYTMLPLLLKSGLPYYLGFGYLAGGLVNITYSFLRTLPLDIGVLRWRKLRQRLKTREVPKILAFPPTKHKNPKEILKRLKEYSVFHD